MSDAWPTARLADLAAPVKGAIAGGPFGSDLVSADYVDEGVPVIRGVNLPFDRKIALDNLVFVSEAKADSLHLNCAVPGDLVFTQRGTLGQVGLLPQHPRYSRYLISQSQMKMTVDPSKASALYLYYYFRLSSSVTYIENHALQSGVPHINLGLLRKLEVILPPLVVQHRIAALLETYNDLIANNQRRIALLEHMAEEIYREWFVRMRCPIDTDANRSPERLRPFDSLCELQRGFDLPDSDMQPGSVPVIASTSIKGFHNVAKVKPPVITTGRSGSLGTVLYVREPAWPLNTSLWVKDFKGNSPNLVYFTLRSLHLENFNAGAGVPTLNRNHLRNIKVRIPTAASQSTFDELVEPILAKAQTLRLACAKLVSTRDALLPRLIAGKLRVDSLDIQFPPSMQPPPAEAAQHVARSR